MSNLRFFLRRCPARTAGLLVVLAAAGCGDSRAPAAGPPPLTAATLGEQAVKPVGKYLSEAPWADASKALGDRLLLQCRSCHSLEAGAGHTLGPNLHGVFGRPAGSAPGYGYTQAFRNADFLWTPRALDAWLARPTAFLPGNAMAFGGIRQAEDRAALIASLMRQTDDSVAAPETAGTLREQQR